ncbi:hypothetical protein CTI14_67435, partial [Methylobacterium radiotolerans]
PPASITRRQRTFGYTEEEVRILLTPMGQTGVEPGLRPPGRPSRARAHRAPAGVDHPAAAHLRLHRGGGPHPPHPDGPDGCRA